MRRPTDLKFFHDPRNAPSACGEKYVDIQLQDKTRARSKETRESCNARKYTVPPATPGICMAYEEGRSSNL